jgi:hypothetical protein
MPVVSNVKKAVFVPNKTPLKDDITSFIYKWNATYPIDRWWRERHKIAFNSPEHRVVSFLDIYVEWQEEQLYIKAREASQKQEDYKRGDWLQERVIDKQREIDEFENIDLSKFDDKEIKK